MTKGILISRGDDVGITSPENLYVGATTPLFKLFKSGSGVQKFSGGLPDTFNITIRHGLGYVPFVLVYMDRNPGTNRRLCTASDQSPISVPSDITAFVVQVTPMDFTIQAQGYGTNGSYGYNYYVYVDKVESLD
jgi:hypothetical protein